MATYNTTTKYFSDNDEINKYLTHVNYGTTDKPYMCYAIVFTQNSNNQYSYYIRYNDSGPNSIDEVPTTDGIRFETLRKETISPPAGF